MTEYFYSNLISFLSIEERKRLNIALNKHKLRFKGFRSLSNVPVQLLASYMNRSEDKFFEIIQEEFKDEYDSIEAAIDCITKDNAISVLSYLSANGNVDENVLDKRISEILECSEETAIRTVNSDYKIKFEAEKNKFQEQRKECLKQRKTINELRKENADKDKTIEEKEQEIQSLKFQIETQLENQKQLDLQVEKFKQNIERQEERIAELNAKIEALTKPTILILSDDKINIPAGKAIIKSYDYIPKLTGKVLKKFSEILYVTNDIPFSTKRQMLKNEGIEEIAHSFSSKSDIIKYIQRGNE